MTERPRSRKGPTGVLPTKKRSGLYLHYPTVIITVSPYSRVSLGSSLRYATLFSDPYETRKR